MRDNDDIVAKTSTTKPTIKLSLSKRTNPCALSAPTTTKKIVTVSNRQFSVIAAILVSLTTSLGFMVLDRHEHGLSGKPVESEKIKIRVKRETMALQKGAPTFPSKALRFNDWIKHLWQKSQELNCRFEAMMSVARSLCFLREQRYFPQTHDSFGYGDCPGPYSSVSLIIPWFVVSRVG
ncbi:unnamed protein product [Malus baccata var. baccata]